MLLGVVWRPYKRESPSTVRGGLLFDAIAGSSDGVTQPSQSRASRVGVHAFVDSIDIGQFRTGGIEVGAHDVSRINLAVGWYGDPPFDGILRADVLGPGLAVIDYGSRTLSLVVRKAKGRQVGQRADR